MICGARGVAFAGTDEAKLPKPEKADDEEGCGGEGDFAAEPELGKLNPPNASASPPKASDLAVEVADGAPPNEGSRVC